VKSNNLKVIAQANLDQYWAETMERAEHFHNLVGKRPQNDFEWNIYENAVRLVAAECAFREGCRLEDAKGGAT
jgi:hypothetical protein